MLEALLAAEVLVVGVLQPARTQGLVREVVHMLKDQKPGNQPGGERRLPGTGATHRAEPPVDEIPVDLSRQACQRMPEIDDLLQGRPEQILVTPIARLAHCSFPET